MDVKTPHCLAEAQALSEQFMDKLRVAMHQTKTRQSFTVVVKSSRRIPAEEGPASLWKDVDLAKAQRLVSQQMEDSSPITQSFNSGGFEQKS